MFIDAATTPEPDPEYNSDIEDPCEVGQVNLRDTHELATGHGALTMIPSRKTFQMIFNGDCIDVYTDLSVIIDPAKMNSVNAMSRAAAQLKPGHWMGDGTIYAGSPPDAGRPM